MDHGFLFYQVSSKFERQQNAIFANTLAESEIVTFVPKRNICQLGHSIKVSILAFFYRIKAIREMAVINLRM